MNSISFLDGVLTRSLSSSRRQSGSNTPSKSSAPASAGPSSSSSHAAAASSDEISRPLGRGPHRIDRRASDYSLAAKGERERRRLALGLELTPVDAPPPVQRTASGLPSGSSSGRKHSSRSTSSTPANLSRRSSTSRRASSSARRSASEAEQASPGTQTHGDAVAPSSLAGADLLLPSPLTNDGDDDNAAQGPSDAASATHAQRPSLSASGRSASASTSSRRHPKSASDGPGDSAAEARARRKALRRSGSTPAPASTPSRARWSTLWGLGSWLDGGAMDGGGLFGEASGSHHARRSASESYAGPEGAKRRKRRASSGSTSAGRARRHRYDDEDEEALAQAAAAALAPELLMSQQEREDVVDFEGGELDEEEEYLSGGVPHVSAPKPTPAAGLSSSSGRTSVPSTPPPKLGSFLFGALASRVDDYFGPQPIQAATIDASNGSPRLASSSATSSKKIQASGRSSGSPPSTPPRASRRGSTASARQLQHGRVVPLVDAQIQTRGAEGSSSSGRASREASDGASAQHDPRKATTAEPSDPPPPYTPTPSDSRASSAPSSPSDEHGPARAAAQSEPSSIGSTAAPPVVARRRSSFRTAASALRRLWELLRRAIMAVLLAPLRAVGLGTPSRRKAVLAQAQQSSTEVPTLSYDGVARAPGEADGKEVKVVKTMGAAEEQEEQEQEEAEEELITEDQAAARAARIAAREARHRARQAELGIVVGPDGALRQAPATPPPLARTQSRLLPSPHAIDPLLMHDKKKLRRAEEDEKSGRKQQQQQQSEKERRLTIPGAASKAAAAAVRGGARGSNTPTSPMGAPNPNSSIIHHSPKILVLDLDETLIHSTSRSPTWSALRASANGGRGARGASVSTGGSLLGLEGIGGMLGLSQRGGVRPHMVEVVLDGRSVIYHVYKRPWVDHFLRKVAQWYHVVIFTASVQEYADPVIDWLDQGRGLISGRLFREACTYRHGSYLKDLTMVSEDLSRVCLLDNSPASYILNQANGIPIEGWTSDDRDTGLLDLLPVLDALRFASDVRHVLSLRGF